MISCSESKKEEIMILDPVDSKKEIVLLSEIASEVNYTFLETKDDAMIGRIDKLLIQDDKIYILDSHGSKSLFIFNLKGQLIHKINDHGQGPGEFTEPGDFTIDEKRGRLYIYCSRLKKICVYGLTGKYIEEWFTELWFSSFQSLENNTFLAFTNNKFNDIDGENYDLIFFSRDQKIIKPLHQNDIKNNQGRLSFSFGKNFIRGTNRLLFFRTFSDTIYQIETNSLTPYFRMDFRSNSIPDFEKRDVISLSKKLNNGQYACIAAVETPGDYIYMNYILHGKNRVLIHNSSTGKTLNIVELRNDLDDGLISTPVGSWNEYLVMVNYPEDLLLQYSGNPLRLKNFNYMPNISDNPILLFIKPDLK